MATNAFGTLFRMTTFGESHGRAIGVVIDGCPAGLDISEDEINVDLACRAPGKSLYTSPRKETDKCEIISGVFEGQTTGAPICILIHNHDQDSSKYTQTKELLRPGHANYTYMHKYGIFDYRGGGRASARETACRVAAGAIARKFLKAFDVHVAAYIKQIGHISAVAPYNTIQELRAATYEDLLFCPDPKASASMLEHLENIIHAGDSIGGVIEFIANPSPGLGEPVYEKLEAKLASAMMSLPASKGFEIGSGFAAAAMRGTQHNDLFIQDSEHIETRTNFAGGILGGISTGMPIIGRVAFKPTSSIKIPQETINFAGQSHIFQHTEGSRHDPCVAIRAVPVVEAMLAITLVDAMLQNRCARV